MPTTITLTGWKEFETKLANMPKILEKEIDGEVWYAAEHWAGLAKRDAPKDVGFLAGGISAKHGVPMSAEVTSSKDYSAYMEWGTKFRVQVPASLQSYAVQFKGRGGGGDMKKFIYAWCERKGIPKTAWWPIFISIVIKGVHAHPFFFIQMPLVEKQLKTNIQNILNSPH